MTDPIRATFAEEDQQLIDFLGRYMISKARAALAKAEPGPTSKASLQVGPPAEGEVKEVLADLLERQASPAFVVPKLSAELIEALQTAQPGRVEPLPGDAQMTDPIRIALERLLSDIHALADESTGVAGLHHNGDIAPWSELLEDGPYSSWLGDAIGAARAALAQPTSPTDGEVEKLVVELNRIADNADFTGQFTDADHISRAAELLQQRHPAPVAVSDDQLDLVVIAIQALTPHQPDATTHDLYAVDRGREILRQSLARWLPFNALPLPEGEGEK